VSGFVFDAKAALARIAARRAGGAAAAVSAVLAVERRAMVQEPQQPQADPSDRDTPRRADQPQEPQQPQKSPIPTINSINNIHVVRRKADVEMDDGSAAVSAVLAVERRNPRHEPQQPQEPQAAPLHSDMPALRSQPQEPQTNPSGNKFRFDTIIERPSIRAVDGVAAVPAVLAVERLATPQEPQQPQEPQRGRTRDGAATLAGKPQEPQQPQGPSDSMGEADAIEERAAVIFGTCPAEYVDVFARLNHQKPFAVSEAEWRQALDDAGRFLDTWGAVAAALRWGAGELFDVPRGGRPGGLFWQLRGQRIGALGEDHARLGDGRTIMRREVAG
jgi:hypothetical protein